MTISCQTKKESIKQPLKVDFDFDGRKMLEVNDPNYVSWPIAAGEELSKEFNDIKITLKGSISSSWYKAGIQAPSYARLVNDGVVAKDSIKIIINGLSEGEHSLLTFHNTFNKQEEPKNTPVHIVVNGENKVSLASSNRSLSTEKSAMSYFTFNAKKDEEVVIRFYTESHSDESLNNLVINGFELDTPNRLKQARTPFPAHNNRHVVMSKDFKLSWEGYVNATFHEVYFGENEASVINADITAKEFKGKQKENEFTISDLYSKQDYFWRIDEIDEEGKRTKGEVWSFKPAQLAFNGAEGYGRFAIGGRGGKVVQVTNLNDDGPGSLRDAVNQDIGPRTIVFNVSGNIKLKSRLVVNQPYITIAGQTAPGKGIMLSRAPLGLTGNDGVIRFLKVRIGAGKTYDGMGLTGANNSIIDHCSISWTIDESFSSRSAHNITLQRTLISEALNVADHGKYKKGQMHGYAATIGGDIGSFHHNLLAHNYGRNWSLGGGLNGDGYYSGRLDITNNVVYNWGKRTTDGGANQVNFVNNYYKPGPSTKFFYALKAQHEGVGKGKQQYFFSGNVMPGYFNASNQEKGRTIKVYKKEGISFETFVFQPFFPSYVTTQKAEDAYKNVLSDVGASLPVLDEHDQRIINETLNASYSAKGSKSGLAGMIDTQEDVGGWEDYPKQAREAHWDTDKDGLPDWWEKYFRLNVASNSGDFSDSNADQNKDGFTQLEDYLDWMAKPHYFITNDEDLALKISQFFKGYTEQPKYKIQTLENVEGVLKNDVFTFKGSKNGLAKIIVEVKDKHGASMQRVINLFVQ